MRVLALQPHNFGSNITSIDKIINKKKGLGMEKVVLDEAKESAPERVLSLALERLFLVAREKDRQLETSLVRMNSVANNVDSSAYAIRRQIIRAQA